jgi:hypothetical protein
MSNGTIYYYGVYRADVVNVVDPNNSGCVKVIVTSIQAEADAETERWAMPCVPFAGPGEGFLVFPDVGDPVWVQFEGGDVTKPVWMGAFWQVGEMPVSEEERRHATFRTAKAELSLDRDQSIVRIKTDQGAVIQLENKVITFEGWPMKFKPVPPVEGNLEARVTALEQALEEMGQP